MHSLMQICTEYLVYMNRCTKISAIFDTSRVIVVLVKRNTVLFSVTDPPLELAFHTQSS